MSACFANVIKKIKMPNRQNILCGDGEIPVTWFLLISVLKKDGNMTPHLANRKHITGLSTIGHITSEWCRKVTSNFTEIESALKSG